MIGTPASRQGDTGQPGDNMNVLLNHVVCIRQKAIIVNFRSSVKNVTPRPEQTGPWPPPGKRWTGTKGSDETEHPWPHTGWES